MCMCACKYWCMFIISMFIYLILTMLWSLLRRHNYMEAYIHVTVMSKYRCSSSLTLVTRIVHVLLWFTSIGTFKLWRTDSYQKSYCGIPRQLVRVVTRGRRIRNRHAPMWPQRDLLASSSQSLAPPQFWQRRKRVSSLNPAFSFILPEIF